MRSTSPPEKFVNTSVGSASVLTIKSQESDTIAVMGTYLQTHTRMKSGETSGEGWSEARAKRKGKIVQAQRNPVENQDEPHHSVCKAKESFYLTCNAAGRGKGITL